MGITPLGLGNGILSNNRLLEGEVRKPVRGTEQQNLQTIQSGVEVSGALPYFDIISSKNSDVGEPSSCCCRQSFTSGLIYFDFGLEHSSASLGFEFCIN